MFSIEVAHSQERLPRRFSRLLELGEWKAHTPIRLPNLPNHAERTCGVAPRGRYLFNTTIIGPVRRPILSARTRLRGKIRGARARDYKVIGRLGLRVVIREQPSL